MTDEATGYQLIVHRAGDAGPTERWHLLCHHVFNLDTRAADRLWKQLPIQLLLAPLHKHDLDQLSHHLDKAGVSSEFIVHPRRHHSCVKHPGLAVDQPCPSCEQVRACQLCMKVEASGLCPSCTVKSRSRRRVLFVGVSAFLGTALVIAGLTTARERQASHWQAPLTVAVYPVIADVSSSVQEFSSQLQPADLEPFVRFINEEGGRYGVENKPVIDLKIGPPITQLPPPRPDDSAPRMDFIMWGINLRLMAHKVRNNASLPTPDVQLFLMYHQPRKRRSLEHVTAQSEAHIAMVHTFIGPEHQTETNIALAHGFLHAMGATDKLGSDDRPLFPSGYARPRRNPLHPQFKAEIMAGVIPLSTTAVQTPSDLGDCVIGTTTAQEIRWITGRTATPDAAGVGE